MGAISHILYICYIIMSLITRSLSNALLVLIASVCFHASSLSGQSYKIKVQINGYTNDTLLLGYHYGDKQYIRDTAFRSKGEYIFQKDSLLEPGMYLIVTKPDHDFFQILVDKDHQKFSIETDFTALNEHLKFKDSKLNSEFNAYVDYLSARRIITDSLNHLLNTEKDSLKSAQYKSQISKIDSEVKSKQDQMIRLNPKSILSLLINWSRDVQIPDFPDIEADKKNQYIFDYYKSHYFDYADFTDDRAVRLPLFTQKIDRYLQKLTIQHPDSIAEALDYLFGKMSPQSENYKFLLSHSLNMYASSKYVGMDAVYVHLVENYYAKGKAPWIDQENLAKMVKDAKSLKPLLIDRIAPDIQLFTKDSVPLKLHDIKSPFTVLIFWAPDCGHCKKAMPSIVEFYNKYKDKGVEVVAVCSQIGTESKKACWEAVDKLSMPSWINLYDPSHSSRFKLIYDLKTTPQIYILDHNKKILTKKIAAEQLGEIMDKLLTIKE